MIQTFKNIFALTEKLIESPFTSSNDEEDEIDIISVSETITEPTTSPTIEKNQELVQTANKTKRRKRKCALYTPVSLAQKRKKRAAKNKKIASVN